jgi:pyruvate dehydrogenase E2 component (dihydrolipoamide acetyltransferase)
MAIPITVPRLGWNMEQGVFVGWLKADRAPVRAGEALFTLESDKATEDIECLDNGVLHVPANGPRAGETVAVGAVIGFILQPSEPIPDGGKSFTSPLQSQPKVVAASTPPSAGKVPARQRPASSPRARRAAANLGIDWKAATGTGRTGRIRERDVLGMAAKSGAPANSTRRIIAERMLASHRSTAPVTLITTVQATNLVNLRDRLKASACEPVPSYTDMIVLLSAHALAQHPVLNSRWEDDRIVTPDGIHIGIAVDTEFGLVVPVVRDVPSLNLTPLARQTRDLIERARQHKLSLAEMQGGTFTVTSLGSIGIDAFTPIINPPECAALGVGRIRRCPVVLDDQIVIRDQMTLSLTFDHRITDGAPGARFLQTLNNLIENASLLTLK